MARGRRTPTLVCTKDATGDYWTCTGSGYEPDKTYLVREDTATKRGTRSLTADSSGDLNFSTTANTEVSVVEEAKPNKAIASFTTGA